MGQVVVAQAGTGAVLCFALTALLGVATAFVYAELSSAFPLTGGEYTMIGRTMGPCPSEDVCTTRNPSGNTQLV